MPSLGLVRYLLARRKRAGRSGLLKKSMWLKQVRHLKNCEIIILRVEGLLGESVVAGTDWVNKIKDKSKINKLPSWIVISVKLIKLNFQVRIWIGYSRHSRSFTYYCFNVFLFFVFLILYCTEYSAVSHRFLKRTATDWAETGLMASDHALRRRPIGYLTKCWSCKMICDLFYWLWLSTGK